MNYILKGDPKEVAKVLQENRIRVDRGVVEFTPCQPDSALDTDSIATLREDLDAKTKSCMEMAASQIELACIIDELVDVITEEGIAISKEIADRLAKFGVNVPESADTVPKSAETADNASESVPEVVPNEPETVEDNKSVEAEDMTEVNLDDVKDIEEADTKGAPAPTPKKKPRSNKSE